LISTKFHDMARHIFDVSICISTTFVRAIYIIILDGWIFISNMPGSSIRGGVEMGKRWKYTRLFYTVIGKGI